MNGKRNRFLFGFALAGGVYTLSVFFVAIMRYRNHMIAEDNPLYSEVDKITKFYQMRQILACILLFFLGYLIVAVILPEISDLLKMILSMPTAVAVWGVISVIVLLLRIPYTKEIMFPLFAILAIILLYLNRKYLALQNLPPFIVKFLIVASLVNVFSTGIIRYTITSDTYYCIYMYGRLIAKVGGLSAETTGSLFETTGIMPALMECFAIFAGFETLQVIHYLLMTGFIVGLVFYLYHTINLYKKKSFLIFTITVITILSATAPLFLMCTSIISHSWMMVYIFICCTCMECINSKINKFLRKRLIYYISMLLLWMVFCRVEAIISVVFMIVCFSYLGISKKELVILSIPALSLATIFHLEMQFMIWQADIILPYGSVFVTGKVLVIMGIAVLLLVAYIIFYNVKWMDMLKKNLPILSILSLLVAIFILCVNDIDRMINNFHSVFYNLEYERWYYFPHFVLFLIIIVLRNKKGYGYWDMLVFGMILTSFAMCMGRIHYLRDGWGDSFNRYILHIVPIILIYLTKEVSALLFGNSYHQAHRL